MREALDALIREMVEKGILFDEARSEFERRFIRLVLEQADGNQSQAAVALGMHRNTLSRKLTELHLDGHRNGAGRVRSGAKPRRVKK